MALGDTSTPVRFLRGQTGNDRNLLLRTFGGEVMAAFDLACKSKDKVEYKSATSASTQFVKTWKATSEYFTPGVELLGNDIDTTEITITIDDILVSHFSVTDIDKMLTHFETRSKFAEASAHELAKVFDKNNYRQLILASRAAADGPFPGGQSITNANFLTSGAIDGKVWLDAIEQAQQLFDDVDVPDSQPRHMVVPKRVFDAMKKATDANGRYLVLDRDIRGDNAPGNTTQLQSFEYEGVVVYHTKNLPTTDESSNVKVYSKYRANYANTKGIIWTPMAACASTMMDISFETTRDVRRLEDFTVCKMLAGHGTLRPECSIELKTA